MTNFLDNMYDNKSLRQVLLLISCVFVLAISSYLCSVVFGYNNDWIVLKWGLWGILALMADFYYACKRYKSLWVVATLLICLSADIFRF